MYKTVLLKLSGEAIADKDFPFCNETIENIALQIKEIASMGVRVGVVIGGGNIARGRLFEQMGFDRVQADYAGMLGTVINALMLSGKLTTLGVKAKAMSAIKAERVDMFDKCVHCSASSAFNRIAEQNHCFEILHRFTVWSTICKRN